MMITIKNESSYSIKVNYPGKIPVTIASRTSGSVEHSRPDNPEKIKIQFLGKQHNPLRTVDCEHVAGTVMVRDREIITKVGSWTIPIFHDHMDGLGVVPCLKDKVTPISIPRELEPPPPIPDRISPTPYTSTSDHYSTYREPIRPSQASRERVSENKRLAIREQHRLLTDIKLDIWEMRKDFEVLKATNRSGSLKGSDYTDKDIDNFFERVEKFNQDCQYDKNDSIGDIQATIKYGQQILDNYDYPVNEILRKLKNNISKEIKSLKDDNNRLYDNDNRQYNEKDYKIYCKYDSLYWGLRNRYLDFCEEFHKYEELSIRSMIDLIKTAEALLNDALVINLKFQLVGVISAIQGWSSRCVKYNIQLPQSYSDFLESYKENEQKELAPLQKIFNEAEKIQQSVIHKYFFPPTAEKQTLNPKKTVVNHCLSPSSSSLFTASSNKPSSSLINRQNDINSSTVQPQLVVQSPIEPVVKKEEIDTSLIEFINICTGIMPNLDTNKPELAAITPPVPSSIAPLPTQSAPRTDLFKRQPFTPDMSAPAKNYRPSAMNESQNPEQAKLYNPPMRTIHGSCSLKLR